MPCSAKKSFTKERDPGMDYVLTVREMFEMMEQQSISFDELEPSSFDDPMGESTGGGVIFSVTGGVLESALRLVSKKLTDNRLGVVEFAGVRGEGGLRHATIELEVDGVLREIKVGVCSGIRHAKKLLQEPNLADKFDFIEVMSCGGGCINGGGSVKSDDPNIVKKRIQSVYSADRKCSLRVCDENPSIQRLYSSYFDAPLSEKAHHVLHTTFFDRSGNVEQ
ncbi:hypothetical protein GEMRC1_004558 [Eukaryota sp. GEM-RC1]